MLFLTQLEQLQHVMRLLWNILYITHFPLVNQSLPASSKHYNYPLSPLQSILRQVWVLQDDNFNTLGFQQLFK